MVYSRARQTGDHRDLHKLGGGARRTGRARKYPFFTSSLPENLMSNPSQSANAALRRYNVPGHMLRVEPRDRRGILPEKLTQTPEPSEADANSLPATRPAMAQADPTWPSVLWFFLEGFALYGASLHGLATTAVTAITSEVGTQRPQELSWRERRKSISLVSSSARAEMTVLEREDAVDRGTFGSGIPSTRDGCGSPAQEVNRSDRSGWLSRIWRAIASRWAKWRREREIKEAVAALAEFDDRTLRDMGILDRSQIEQAARYGRNLLI